MKRMIRVALDFSSTILSFTAGWLVWIAALVLLNGVVPIMFLPAPEAVVTLAVFMVAMMLQMALFGRHGFVTFWGSPTLRGWPWSPGPGTGAKHSLRALRCASG